ncbi:hypothetical protein HQQ80_04600 [Microbacteriaceae bacterium VKM Ac-2855]|nr:hypothetical protein [Microbacteriaceae bacterium VKM Ac-2855]
MNGRERSPQRLDPLGALDAWPVAVLCALMGSLGAVASTVAAWSDERPLWLVAAASLATVAAMVITVLHAHPSRAPFSRGWFLAAVALATIGAAGSAAAESHMPSVTMWGPYALALFFVAVASYRSSRTLIVCGSAATAIILATAFIRIELAGDRFTGVLLAALVASSPVLGASLGAAAYSRSYVRDVAQWRERAAREAKDFALEQHERLAADVHENVLGVLNREMLPFFRRLLEKDAIVEDDSENARSIADAVRRIVVAENDRSWLDHVLVREWSTRAEAADPKTFVHDPERIVDEIEGAARAALIAYVILVVRRGSGTASARTSASTPDGSGLRVIARTDGHRRTLEIVVDARVFRGDGRAELRPYLSVLYAAFDEVAIIRAGERLTLRLTYGHPNDR